MSTAFEDALQRALADPAPVPTPAPPPPTIDVHPVVEVTLPAGPVAVVVERMPLHRWRLTPHRDPQSLLIQYIDMEAVQ